MAGMRSNLWQAEIEQILLKGATGADNDQVSKYQNAGDTISKILPDSKTENYGSLILYNLKSALA